MTIILSIFYPLSLFQKKNSKKITFISLSSNKLTRDFALVSRALQYEGKYDLNYVLFNYDNSIYSQFKYIFVCIKQLFAMNSSTLVILDFNNFVVSEFKREGVVALQLWHASGAIKKFGNSTNRDYKVKNYDYAICNSDIFVEPFSDAFNIPKENIKITGIPETDKLFKNKRIADNKIKMIVKYPQLRGKTVITYAPTFRGRIAKGFREVDLNLEYLLNELGDDYFIIYKPHPLIPSPKFENNPNILMAQKESIKKVFSITDILISDYSAIIIDFLTTGRPLISYVPDLEDYKKSPGIYFDYNGLMGDIICYTEDQVIDKIRNYDFSNNELSEFYDKVFKYKDGKSTRRVVNLIDEIMEK